MDPEETEIPQQTEGKDLTQFYIGLGLAISSSLFIGASFVIKKISLLRLKGTGNLSAGQGGFGYLKDWVWWLGLFSMAIGEFANFTAYSFAPASLVTPLGALSVLVAAILSSRFLKERLNVIGKLGCILCILGSIIIVLHSPREEEIESTSALLNMMAHPAFITYVITILIVSFAIAFYFGPTYGSRHVVVYIVLCSAIGSLTVLSCKGLGLALREDAESSGVKFANWLVYLFLLLVVVCVFVQMNYLNKALDLFATSVVTPVYYVFFTTLVILASAILFREWRKASAEDILGDVCGFFVVLIAIVLLQCFKDLDLIMRRMSNNMP